MAKRFVLRELYNPLKQAQLTPTVDLVLVHGLDGDSLETWTWRDNSSKVVWPQDLLPEVQPRTRVLSFGYNADYHNNTNSTIRDNARSLLGILRTRRSKKPDASTRPLIFVGHCLGGLVIKQALCFAHNEPEFHPLFSSTKGVIFFGTPHGGADKSAWKLIAKDYSSFSSGHSSVLVDAITRASDDLEEIKEDFVQLAPRFGITSFYETGHRGDTERCIVSETSARMMVGNEYAMAVDADHRDMCQFREAEDAVFEVLCQRIEEAVGVGVLLEGGEGGRGAGTGGGEGLVRQATTVSEGEVEVAMLVQNRPEMMPAWPAAGHYDMFGGDMGGYTPRKVMMIEFEKQMPGDGLARELRGRERAAVVEEVSVPVSQGEEVLGTAPTVPQMGGQNKRGRGRGFFQWMNRRRRLRS